MAEEKTLSFARDIRTMFTDTDVAHMSRMMDLSSRDSVYSHAQAIYETVTEGVMPPPGSGEARWSKEQCALFKAWMDQGGPA